jgi:DNA-binding NarL/FixJ family response regulator
VRKIKIVLADDHQFLLEGITAVLSKVSEIEIVATAQNIFELMDVLSKHEPSLAIVDLNMPGDVGWKSIQRIRLNFPAMKILVLANYCLPELVDEARKLRVDGYMIKSSTGDELKQAIRDILSGNKYFPRLLSMTETLNSPGFLDELPRKFQLTRREVDIIRMICSEMSTREIASALFLSELTINTHRRNILRKLDVKNVAGLMNFAREHQLV